MQIADDRCAGHTACVGFEVVEHVFGQGAEGDDVGDGEATAGFEDAESFAIDLRFIGGEVDDAVRDNDVYGVVS